jgi:hypothetical protein
MALNNDDIKQLIAILQRGLTSDSNEIPEEIEKPSQETKPIKTKSKNIKTKKVKISEEDHGNVFESMPEKNMHRDDIEIDRKLSTYAPTTRARKFNTINVVCRVCGRKDEVSPSLVYEGASRYKCNKCARSPG